MFHCHHNLTRKALSPQLTGEETEAQKGSVTHLLEVLLLSARVLLHSVGADDVSGAQSHDALKRKEALPVSLSPALRLTLQSLVLLLRRLQVLQGLLVGGLDLEALCHVQAALLLRAVHLHLQLFALLLPLGQHLVKDPLLLVQGSGCSIGLGRGGNGLQGSDFPAPSPPLPSSLPSPPLPSNSGDRRLLGGWEIIPHVWHKQGAESLERAASHFLSFYY